jgi:hypothetical protein
VAGTKDPPVAWILFSWEKYEIPRTIWNMILVIKKAMAKRALLLRCGNNVEIPRTKVGICNPSTNGCHEQRRPSLP